MKKLAVLFIMGVFLFLPSEIKGEIVYTQDELTTIEEAGTYPVYLSTEDEEGETIQQVFYMTLTFPNTIITKANGEGIDASDFELEKGKLDEVTDAELIDIASARAWSLGDGSEIPIVKVTRKEDGNQIYRVSFTTEKGTEVTVAGIITENGSIFSDSEFMYLHHSSWEHSYFSQLTFLIVLLLVVPLLLISILVFLFQKKLGKVKRLLFPKSHNQHKSNKEN